MTQVSFFFPFFFFVFFFLGFVFCLVFFVVFFFCVVVSINATRRLLKKMTSFSCTSDPPEKLLKK